MNIRFFIKSFVYASNGIGHFFRNDRNGKIHLLAAILVLAAGWYYDISVTEWCILIGCIGMVIGFEMLNAAVEKICDMLHSEWHPVVKVVKDVAAGAVLWSAITSAAIGLLIFIPKIFV